MQNFNKHKLVVLVSLVTVLALALVTLWSPANFLFKSEQVDTAKQQADFLAEQARLQAEYERLLAETKTDQEASRRILAKVIDPADVKKMVEDNLSIKSSPVIPSADATKIIINPNDNTDVLREYLKNISLELTRTSGVNTLVNSAVSGTLSQEEFVSLKNNLNSLLSGLYGVSVPKSARDYHLALLDVETSILNIVMAYEPNKMDNTEYSPWPVLYSAHSKINRSVWQMQELAKELEARYGTIQVELKLAEAGSREDVQNVLSRLFSFKQASAFIGSPIPQPVITLKDLPRLVIDTLKEVMASAYAKFAFKMLESYAKKIEDSFLISNILYYRDTLVSARYSDDFIRKYLPDVKKDSPEAKLIKSFIPEVGCGKGVTDAQRALINKQVLEYLGFDPKDPIDPNDADFYDKINRSGHFASSSSGLTEVYRAIASVVGNRARETAQSELYIPGKKVPVMSFPGIGGGQTVVTAKSLDAISSQQKAAFTGSIEIGNPNANNAAGLVWISNIAILLNKFLIKGSIFKEQATCIDTPQLEALTPIANPNSTDPSAGGILNCYDLYTGADTNPSDALKCVDDALNQIAVGDGSPVAPPRNPSPITGTGVVMDKNCYVVGEVPNLAIREAPTRELVYWSLYRQPSGEVVYQNVNFEDSGGPQQTDSQGNWPSGSTTAPAENALTSADLGEWTRSAKVGTQEFRFNYRVVSARGECNATR